MSETYTITPEAVAMLREMFDLQARFFRGDRTVVGRYKALKREARTWLARYPKPDEPNLFEEEDH